MLRLLCLAALASLAHARPLIRLIKDYAEYKKLLKHHASTTGLPVIVDFYSDGCGPCRMIAPAYKALAKEYKDKAVFAKVDMGRSSDISGPLGIRSMPTFHFYVDGALVNTISGAGEAQMKEYTKAAVREAEGMRVELTLEALTAYYAVHDTAKTPEDLERLWGKCAAHRKAHDGKCNFGAAQELAKKLRQKFKKSPKLEKLPAYAAGDSTASSPEAEKTSTGKPEASGGPAPAPRARRAAAQPADGLGSVSDDQLLAEMAKRGLEPERPEGAGGEDEDDEDDDEELGAWAPSSFAERVVIIGGGPAGLAAAIYASRSGLAPVVIAPLEGGQLRGKGVDVENYPGMTDVTGPAVVDAMRHQASALGAAFEPRLVEALDLSTRPFTLAITGTGNVTAHAVIVATGAESRWLGVPGEYELRGGGVSACATCDGFLYRDVPVVVVGGGDTAMEDALVLARTASAVTVVHRRGAFRASHVLAQRVLTHDKITVVWNATVESFERRTQEDAGGGASREVLKAVRVKDVATGAVTDLSAEACFVAIGHDPTTGLVAGQVETDSEGYVVVTPGTTKSSVEGLFACGDVADKVYRQAVTSAGTGAMAALDAERWLSEMGIGDEAAEFEAEMIAELLADMQGTSGDFANAYDEDLSFARRKEKVREDKPAAAAAADDGAGPWAGDAGLSGDGAVEGDGDDEEEILLD